MEEEGTGSSKKLYTEGNAVLEVKTSNETICKSEEGLVKNQVIENKISDQKELTNGTELRHSPLMVPQSAEIVSCNAVINNNSTEGINQEKIVINDVKQASNDKVPNKVGAKCEKDTDKRFSKIDFTVFEESFYRRYKSFFSNDSEVAEIDLSQDKSTVSKMINGHFSNFEINPVDVIRTFLVLRKNSENSHGHFIMSPAQSPEPNLLPAEGNGRSKRCANKDINSGINDTDPSINETSGIDSFKNDYKTETSAAVENNSETGVSTRNSRKGRIPGRGKK
ncbi:hypothetical protein FG386_003018 [Cryptosporidium ryanae]|uniref:uncharacterized protein n=1 Tax=Cryptosporidium ryanae TaxID=515981 RepID=UPI00351A1CC0|nr:hypothetical protein FG386_003018 [Cryptosporidium ryanae]